MLTDLHFFIHSVKTWKWHWFLTQLFVWFSPNINRGLKLLLIIITALLSMTNRVTIWYKLLFFVSYIQHYYFMCWKVKCQLQKVARGPIDLAESSNKNSMEIGRNLWIFMRVIRFRTCILFSRYIFYYSCRFCMVLSVQH